MQNLVEKRSVSVLPPTRTKIAMRVTISNASSTSVIAIEIMDHRTATVSEIHFCSKSKK